MRKQATNKADRGRRTDWHASAYPLALVVVGLAFVACSEGSGGDAGEGETGATGPTAPLCQNDIDCECDDGRRGLTECTAGEEACNCDICVQFDDEPDPFFDACGGDPVGVWISSNVDSSQVRMRVYERDAAGYRQLAGTCETKTTAISAGVDLRLRLDTGGAGEIITNGGSMSFVVEDECVTSLVSPHCYELEDVECADAGCNQCSCRTTIWERTSEVQWTATGGWVTFDSSTGLPYCIEGNTMRLRDPDGDVEFTLERGTLQLVPGSSETCTLATYGTVSDCLFVPADEES